MRAVDVRPLWPALAASMVLLVFGCALGAFTGVGKPGYERWMAAHLVDAPAAESRVVMDASWRFLQRAHVHAGSMSTGALVISFALAMTSGAAVLRRAISIVLALGAAGYTAVLLLAALRIPIVGDIEAAKAPLTSLAMATTGAYMTAAAGAVALFGWSMRRTPPARLS